MRIVAYEDDTFKLEYERKRGDMFIHCNVFDWTLSSFKRGKKVFEEFKKKRLEEGVEVFYTISPNPKFCVLLGGELIGYLQKRNKRYEVFRWVLQKESQPSL